MPFQHACFISYRHCQSELGKRIVNDLYEAIAGELELMTERTVYLDRERLEGGYFYNEALARDLCKSVCMISVFTPTYFSLDHKYCAREFQAMENLERERLALLADPGDQSRGLIIPIVFRGWNSIPPHIKERRLCYNFAEFLLSDDGMHRHPSYAPKIRQIAEYVAERCNRFEALGVDPCATCDEFPLPSEEEVEPWLREVVTSQVPFPGR